MRDSINWHKAWEKAGYDPKLWSQMPLYQWRAIIIHNHCIYGIFIIKTALFHRRKSVPHERIIMAQSQHWIQSTPFCSKITCKTTMALTAAPLLSSRRLQSLTCRLVSRCSQIEDAKDNLALPAQHVTPGSIHYPAVSSLLALAHGGLLSRFSVSGRLNI